jgi:hypothetical protein
MPAAAVEPSGTWVERLCGHPEQKYGWQRQPGRALAQRLEQRHPRGDRLEVQALLQPTGDDLGDAVGVELAVGGHQGPALLVALADDARVHRVVVEDVAQEHLDERALLLDDQDLLEPAREPADDPRLHREEHADLEDADAVAPQRRVVQAELAQRLAQVVVRLAGGGDAEPGIGGVHRDPIDPIGGGEGLGRFQASVGDLALHLQPVGRQQQRVLRVPPRLALIDEAGIHDRDAPGPDLGGAELVGDVRHDLEAHPQSGVPAQLEAQPPEVENLLDVAGEQHRELRVVERHLGVGGQRRGLRERIVAAQRQHAAVPAHAGEVGVLEDVPGAVDAGSLAVPDAQHAVVLRLRKIVGELAAVDGGGAEVFVEAGDEDDVVLAQQRRIALEREIESAERGAAIARDQCRGVEPAAAVGPVLIERQPDQRLDAGQEDDALLLAILRVEREVVGDGYGPSGRI